MENTFEEIGVNPALIEGLKVKNIMEPTEIQKKVIPLALLNKDIIAQSETGTGKTLAYLLPLFQKIDASKREMQAIILTPTHELTMQIYTEVQELSKNSNALITSTSIIGDVNINRQIEKLKEKPHIIVGSPVRILDLIKKKKIAAHTVKTIIVDEADRLLDRKNVESIKAVIKTTLKERQLIFTSATFSSEAIITSKEQMKEAEVVKIEEKNTVNKDIEHYYLQCTLRDKILLLRKLVSAVNPKKAIVFINNPNDMDNITSKLKYHNLKVASLRGTNIKEERRKALQDFKNGNIQLLVASDIAARGLDIENVALIINFDIPEDPKDYLHRVGRTGRAGKAGMAVSLITFKEKEFIKEYARTFKIDIFERELHNGNLVDIKK